MTATSLDLSQIRTDSLSSAATFRTLIGVYSEAEVDALIAAIPGGVTDHGALTGLADDDHTQYALADGSRGAFVKGSTGSTDNRILRADGTGGSTVQGSAATLDDFGNITAGAATFSGDVTLTGAANGLRLNPGGTSRGLIYYSSSENRLNSTSAHPWVVESDAGFKVRNAANSSDAPITAGGGTFSGELKSTGPSASVFLTSTKPIRLGDYVYLQDIGSFGKLRISDGDVKGVVLDTSTDGTLSIRNRLDSAAGNITAGAATFSGVVTMSAGASIGDWTNWPGIFRVGGGYSAQIARDLIFCFNSANATVGGTPEVGFCRGSSTAFEINNGTLGQYRDLLARQATFSGALNLAGITKTALLALTPNASTGGRWRVTDSSPAQREAYPDGTNWRYTSDDAIVT